jgi:hypothetical protein
MRTVDDPLRLFDTLDAVDRDLHVVIEVLDAEADAIEAETGEPRDRCVRHGARIDFDR